MYLTDGMVLYAPLINSFEQALAGKYVKSGLDVSANGGMDILISSGVVSALSTKSEYTTSDKIITLSPAYSDKDRIDLVVYDITQNDVIVLDGNTWFDGNPASPVPNVNQIPLAVIRIPMNATSIDDTNIYDIRINRNPQLWYWSDIPIDDDKDMGGKSLYNVGNMYDKDNVRKLILVLGD
jgi:hypothetical protein